MGFARSNQGTVVSSCITNIVELYVAMVRLAEGMATMSLLKFLGPSLDTPLKQTCVLFSSLSVSRET